MAIFLAFVTVVGTAGVAFAGSELPEGGSDAANPPVSDSEPAPEGGAEITPPVNEAGEAPPADEGEKAPPAEEAVGSVPPASEDETPPPAEEAGAPAPAEDDEKEAEDPARAPEADANAPEDEGKVGEKAPEDVSPLDADSISVIAIRLGSETQTDNTSIAVRSGAESQVVVQFLVNKAVAAGEMMFRIDLGQNFAPVSVRSNSQYTLSPGDAGGPTPTNTNTGYWWVTWIGGEMASTTLRDFTFTVTPFKNFVTPQGDVCTVDVLPYDSDGAGNPTTTSGPPKTNTGFTALVDKFDWNPLTSGIAYTGGLGATNTNPVTGADAAPINLSLSTSKAATMTGPGQMYADGAVLQSRYVVDMQASSPNNPLLLIEKGSDTISFSDSQFYDAGGSIHLYAGTQAELGLLGASLPDEYCLINETVTGDFGYGPKTYITDFTLVSKLTNGTLNDGDDSNDADLSPSSTSFVIKDAKFNAVDIISEYSLGSGATSSTPVTLLKQVDGTQAGYAVPTDQPDSLISPWKAVSVIGTTDQSIKNPVLGDFALYYKNDNESGYETFAGGHFAFGKKIVEIAHTPTTGTVDDTLGAFAGNIVTYQFSGTNTGSGTNTTFRNLQKAVIPSLIITDDGFVNDEIQPIFIDPGEVAGPNTGAGLKFEFYKGTTLIPSLSKTYTDTDFPVPSLYTIDQSDSDYGNITKIVITYTNIPKNFEIKTWPSIGYVVQNLDVDREYDYIYNTATAKYTYTTADLGSPIDTETDTVDGVSGKYAQSDIAKFMYKIKSENMRDRYGYHKSGTNLTTGDHTLPVSGDVIGYTAWVNNANGPGVTMLFETFVDTLSAGQEYYTGDGTGLADTSFINDPVAANVKLYMAGITKNADGSITQGTPTPITVSSNPSLDDLLGSGNDLETSGVVTVAPKSGTTPATLTINFDSGAEIPADTQLIITYTTKAMTGSIATPATFRNQFELSNSSGDVIGKGRFQWGPPVPSDNSGRKTASNISEGVLADGNPIAGDLILFKIKVMNTTDAPITNPIVTDTYVNYDGADSFVPVTGSLDYTDFNNSADAQKLIAAGLTPNMPNPAFNPLLPEDPSTNPRAIPNLAYSPSSAIVLSPLKFFVYDDPLNLTSSVTAAPTAIISGGTGGTFNIALTGTLAPGEWIEYAYVMEVAPSVIGGDYLYNFYTTYDGQNPNSNHPIDSGYAELIADSTASKIGYSHVVKSAKGVGSPAPKIGNLIHEDQVAYTIDIGNYHARYGIDKVLHITGITDALPAHVSLNTVPDASNPPMEVPDLTVYRVILDDDATELSRTPIDPTAYTVTYTPGENPPGGPVTNDSFAIEFSPQLDLPAGLTSTAVPLYGVTDKVAKNRILVEYSATVDTLSDKYPGIPETSPNVSARNNAKVYLAEDSDDIHSASGSLVDLGTSVDPFTGSKSYVLSYVDLTLINSDYITAGIKKEVSAGSAALNLSNAGDLVRDYTVTIENHSLAPLDLRRIVDLLPRYESLVTTGSGAPRITYYDSSGDADGPYALHVMTNNTYDYDLPTWGATYQVGRVIFDRSDRPNSVAHPNGSALTVDKAKKDSSDTSKTKPAKIVITYSGKVNKAAALSDYRDITTATVNTKTYANHVAMYPLRDGSDSQPATAIHLTTGGGTYGEPGDTQDWDGDASTVYRYQNSVAVTLADASTSPFVGIAPKIINASGAQETLSPYNPAVDTISRGDNVAFEVALGNFTNATAEIKAGSKVVLAIPAGLTYLGFEKDSGDPLGIDQLIPAFFTNPSPQITDVGGTKYLVWEIKDDIPAAAVASNPKFTIRTATDASRYAEYAVQGYFVPKQTADQFFYDNIVSAAQPLTGLTYAADYQNLSSIGFGAADQHLVHTDASISVFGSLGINASMTLTEDDPAPAASNSVSTANANARILTLGDSADERDHTFTYAMFLNIKPASAGLENPVVINRLPQLNDTRVTGADKRGSQVRVVLADNSTEVSPPTPITLGNVTPSLVYLDGSPIPGTETALLDPFNLAVWKIEYATGGPTEVFGDDDFEGTPISRWKDAAAISDPSDVTAIRISLASGTYTVPAGCSLKITFVAQLDEGYNIPYLTGFDSFGFSGTVGAAPVTAEPLTLGVRTHVPYNRLLVTKVLKDNTADPRHKAHPFAVDIFGTDAGGKNLIETLTFDNLQLTGGSYQQTIEASLLNYGVFPSAVETNNPTGYKTPVIPRATQGATGQYGNTIYYITVTNEPNLHRVYYNANGGRGSQTDTVTYYRGDAVSILDRGSMTRSGHTFVGWNTERDGSGISYSENQVSAFTINGTVTLYAQWADDTRYSVTYFANGGRGSQVDAKSPYLPGKTVKVLGRGSIVRDGYTFVGWNTKPDGSGTANAKIYVQGDTFVILKNMNFYAQWDKDEDPPPDDPPPPTPPEPPVPPRPPRPPIVVPPDVTPPGAPEPPGPALIPPTATTTRPEPEPVVPEAPVDPSPYERQTGNPLIDLLGGNVPGGSFEGADVWSLLSMILSIIGVLIAIVLSVGAATRKRRRKEAEENRFRSLTDEEEKAVEKRQKRTNLTRILAIIVGVLVIVVWLLLDDLTLPMAWINKWTLYVIITFAVHLVLVFVHKRVANKEDEEDDEGDDIAKTA
ncbi:MAG: InlB B-repeat-containing protein [Clostridiales Family XIII bacterium]|nr:InlB B-repeat-containing protein [Clostridiales Family XIII bacterium]